MYVGNQHTATVEKLIPLDFSCRSCGHEQTAIVWSWGQGAGNSAYFLDEEGAKGRAAASAGVQAHKNAEKMLALASCPACFVPDDEALGRHKTKKTLAYLALVAGCGLLALVLAALIEPGWAYGIAAASCAGGLWAAWMQNRAIEQGAGVRVIFPDGTDEPDGNALPLCS